ncbi:MAG: hypothetical protein AB3N28_04800 [Kordiimonas sp.]
MMFSKPSLTKRFLVAKTVGFLFGLFGFAFLTIFLPDTSDMVRWGILCWYTTVGVLVGAVGVYTKHPILGFPMPWWFRAPMIGSWMNFVLTLFAYEMLADLMLVLFGENGSLQSPFWFVAEGAFVGLVIGYFATKLGGEGEALPVLGS